MDEAASRLSIEINSVPADIDTIERKIKHLQVEREALKKESDERSKKRLGEIDRELASLGEENRGLRARFEKEREEILSAKKIKKELESLRNDFDRAEREGALERAAELKYGRIPELERRLQALEKREPARSDKPRMLREEVGPEEIAVIVARWTGIPVDKMLQSEMEKLLHMEDHLRRRVVGQDKALTVVADAIRRSRAEISDPHRPIGSFMFLGPTGVGKTETVKALAEFLFDSGETVVRIDMSEYMEKHAVSRLIGAPPGYVGYEEGGQLTEQVRRRPYSVVLLDEIEKAHPDVFNVLLQVLDEGRLTDGQGRTVDFKNSVLVLTSNIGSQSIIDEQLSPAERETAVREALKRHFRPEFLNRLDETIIFNSLGESQVHDIVRVQLRDVEARLKAKEISIEFEDSAVGYLARKGFDPLYGARPLRRVIQSELLNELARLMIGGRLRAGQTVAVRGNDLRLELQVT
jgi:ATP-dependent Clp protease ATP-binding subunit ClpB